MNFEKYTIPLNREQLTRESKTVQYNELRAVDQEKLTAEERDNARNAICEKYKKIWRDNDAAYYNLQADLMRQFKIDVEIDIDFADWPEDLRASVHSAVSDRLGDSPYEELYKEYEKVTDLMVKAFLAGMKMGRQEVREGR